MAQLEEAVQRGYFGYCALVQDPWLTFVRESDLFRRIVGRCELAHRRAQEAFSDYGGFALLDCETLHRYDCSDDNTPLSGRCP
jgi:hypothetical protein